MKRISCRDVGVECDFVATGKTDDEVMKACAEHGKTAHNMDNLPPDLVAKVKAGIKEV